MKELNKTNSQDAMSVTGTLAKCFCVCVCLVFTEKRHSDLLDALHAVQN